MSKHRVGHGTLVGPDEREVDVHGDGQQDGRELGPVDVQRPLDERRQAAERLDVRARVDARAKGGQRGVLGLAGPVLRREALQRIVRARRSAQLGLQRIQRPREPATLEVREHGVVRSGRGHLGSRRAWAIAADVARSWTRGAWRVADRRQGRQRAPKRIVQ